MIRSSRTAQTLAAAALAGWLGLFAPQPWAADVKNAGEAVPVEVTQTPADESSVTTAEFDEDQEFIDEFEDETAEIDVYDPLQTFNRGMFWFNDKLYFYVMKPVARGFRYIPESGRVSVSNFFNNLLAPVQGLNALLQGKVNDAGTAFSRFIINSTLGIGGLFDPALKWGNLRPVDEDFGQTLGAWGLGQGFYLVIPVLGPSSVRDGVGSLAGIYVDPLGEIWQDTDYWAARSVDAVNTLSLDKDTYEAIKRDALDPYLFTRDAYMQYRAGKVAR